MFLCFFTFDISAINLKFLFQNYIINNKPLFFIGFITKIKMSQNLRNEVLRAFKALHGARKSVFNGDQRTLEAARKKINEEFKKNKYVNDEGSIKDLVLLAKDVENELRSTVIQAVRVAPDKYRLRLTADTGKYEDAPYRKSNAN